MSADSQTFLRELDKKLWTAADMRLKERGHPARSYKITSTGKLIDDTLEAVEKENTRNGGLRSASFSSPRRAIRNESIPDIAGGKSPLPNLAGLIDLIATT